MKSFLPVFVFLCYSILLHAQRMELFNYHGNPNLQYILQAQFEKNNNKAAKTTGQQKRLIANSVREDTSLTDSTHFDYSWGRGSTLSDLNSYQEDRSVIWLAYDDKRNIFCDRSWYLNTTVNINESKSYTYDAGNRITHMDYYNLVDNMYTTVDFTYDASGNRSMITFSDTFNGTQLVAKQKHYRLYDAQNRLRGDSLVDIANKYSCMANEWTYNSNGLLSGSRAYAYDFSNGNPWNYLYDEYVYDNKARLVSSRRQYDMSMTGLQNEAFDSFVYTGNEVKFIKSMRFVWLGTWAPVETKTYHYNTLGLVDTMCNFIYSTAWDTVDKTIYTYDNNSLLRYFKTYKYTGQGAYSSNAYKVGTMYYEDYDPTSIKTVSDIAESVELFPNPASTVLNISGINCTEVAVINMFGQSIMNIDNSQLSKGNVSISSLTPGRYILQVKDSIGRIGYKRFIKL